MGKRSRKARRTPAPAQTPPARRRLRLGTAGLILLLVAGLAWGASLLVAQVNQAALLARLPPAPDLSDKSAELKQALAAAEEAFRQSVRAGDEVEIGRAAGALGRLYHANSYTEQAARTYELAMELDRDAPRWPYYLASLRQEKGDSTSVQGLLERTVALAPDYSPAWLKLADNQFKQGDDDRARASYERRLALAPGDGYAHLGLARIALAAGRWETAESHLMQAVEHGPAFDSTYRLLASVHEHFGRRQQMQTALVQADRASRFAPAPDPWVDALLEDCFDVDWLLFQLGRYAYVDGGRMAQALFERAMQLDPRNPQVYLVFGQHARSLEEARRAYETATSLDPTSGEAHAYLGEALLMEQRPEAAEAALRKALELGWDRAPVHRNLGLALARPGSFQEALAHARRAVTLQPESASANYSLAWVLRASGRTEEAVQQYRRLLAMRPSHARALSDLKQLTQSRP